MKREAYRLTVVLTLLVVATIMLVQCGSDPQQPPQVSVVVNLPPAVIGPSPTPKASTSPTPSPTPRPHRDDGGDD